jgi:hypothetical protein
MFIAPMPPTNLLVATAGGVVILRREGPDRPWQLTETALRDLHPSALLMEPHGKGRFAGIHNGGLYFSDDDGATWERRASGLHIEHVFSLRAAYGADGTAILAGTEPVSLFKSLYYGSSWEELPAIHQVPNTERWTFPGPPHRAHTKTLAIDPRDSNVMYAGIEQGGLLATSDGGASWREIDAYYTPEDMWYRDIHQVVLRPGHPDEIFMNTGIGFYHSPDRGQTWEHRAGPMRESGIQISWCSRHWTTARCSSRAREAIQPHGARRARLIRLSSRATTPVALGVGLEPGCHRRCSTISKRWRSPRTPADPPCSSATLEATCTAARIKLRAGPCLPTASRRSRRAHTIKPSNRQLRDRRCLPRLPTAVER